MLFLCIELDGKLSGKRCLLVCMFPHFFIFFNADTCFLCSHFVPLVNMDTVFYTMNFNITNKMSVVHFD